jgi:large subunit ribosomal protein L9
VGAIKSAGGPALDKRTVELPEGHIKATGKYPVVVNLHGNIAAKFSLTVAAGE